MAIKKLPSTGDAPRATGVPSSLVPGGDADSAGFPWEGRDFDHHGTAFADDTGETPEEWAAALSAVRSAQDAEAQAQAQARALVALSRIRLLIPLLAEAGDVGVTPEGRPVEKTQELSIVTVTAPDGRRALPVFSSVAAMRHWNPGARPIPVPGPQAALAAAQDGTDLLIIDPGTPEHEFGVRRTQLEAMALGRFVLPSWADPEVLAAFEASLAGDQRVRRIALSAGDPEARLLDAETRVILSLEPGLRQQDLDALIALLRQRWSQSEVIAARVDSLRVALNDSAQHDGAQ